MDIEKAEAFIKSKKYANQVEFPQTHSAGEIYRIMQEYSNQQNAKLLQQNKELAEDKRVLLSKLSQLVRSLKRIYNSDKEALNVFDVDRLNSAIELQVSMTTIDKSKILNQQ